MVKPQLPAGLRDFGPDEVYKRNYIFDRIRKIFEHFGYYPLETPAFETSATLTEKYGEEGDQLLYRILKSGNYLEKVPGEVWQSGDYKQLLPYISDKGLRYDLTVPLARYVAMNTNKISFPYKRYQFQPVWRADKPQKGRYREFYQCDADVLGSRSLVYEAEMITLFDAVFDELGIYQVNLEINSRKVLMGFAESFGFADKFSDFTIALDKLDKIGLDGVKKELDQRGIPSEVLAKIEPVLGDTTYKEKIQFLEEYFDANSTGLEGVKEIQRVNEMVNAVKLNSTKLDFNLTLARGLDYYTGVIFEAVPRDVKMGSIASGGRYDDLTHYFNLPDVSGIGISFGMERIYDLMEEKGIFPEMAGDRSQVMVIQQDAEKEVYAFQVVTELRKRGISTEVTPDTKRLGKQLKYADKREVVYALILNPADSGYSKFTLKHMESGQQWDYEDFEKVKAFLHPNSRL